MSSEEVARLERRIARERRARQQAEDIAEEATARLYGSVRQLEQEHDGLRALVAAATHDIKNPLSSIRGLVQLLELPDLDPDKRAQILARLTSSALYTEQLINGLLSVLGAGLQGQPAETIALDDVVADVALEISARHPHTTVVASALGHVFMPPVDAHRLMDNLAENAARYADVDQVEVRFDVVQRTPSRLTVRVADNGNGVSPEDRDRIFGIFQRGTGRDRAGGSGVGLAVCRRLAQASGGDLELDDKPSPTGGAAFLVRLPRPARPVG